MRIVFIYIVVGLLVLGSLSGLLNAQTCAYRDGGYCVSAIADQTAIKLGMQRVSLDSAKLGDAVRTSEGVLGGTEYLNYYETIWDEMVKDGKATAQDRTKAFEEAEKAGGTKIGGVNLVVLSAMTLQQLVDKKILTKDEAQNILNGAKQRE